MHIFPVKISLGGYFRPFLINTVQTLQNYVKHILHGKDEINYQIIKV